MIKQAIRETLDILHKNQIFAHELEQKMNEYSYDSHGEFWNHKPISKLNKGELTDYLSALTLIL